MTVTELFRAWADACVAKDVDTMADLYCADATHAFPFRDGTPVRASRARRLSEAIVAVGDFATGPDAAALNAPRLRVTGQLAAVALRVRMLGSAAADLAWVADGTLGAMVTLINQSWDMAAGACIAAEAGAAVTDAEGRPYTLDSTEILAGAPAVVREVAAMVRSARSAVAA